MAPFLPLSSLKEIYFDVLYNEIRYIESEENKFPDRETGRKEAYMATTIKDALQSKNGDEVQVEGILNNLMEGITKTGKPYISGELFANGYTISFKVWDFALERWLAEKGLEQGMAVTVHGSISINPLNGEKQICIRDGEGDASIKRLEEEGILERLATTTAVSVEKMLGSIRGLIDKYMPEPQEGASEHPLRRYALSAYQNLEENSYYPYSRDIHMEKGGFIAHIYECCHKIVYSVGVPEDIQWDVVLTAILFYHLGWVNRAEVDKITGIVLNIDDYRAIEYGSAGIYDSMIATSMLSLRDGSVNPKVRNTAHCVCALNGIAEAVSLEAAQAVTIINNELLTYSISEGLRGVDELFGKTSKLVNGEIKNFIRY